MGLALPDAATKWDMWAAANKVANEGPDRRLQQAYIQTSKPQLFSQLVLLAC